MVLLRIWIPRRSLLYRTEGYLLRVVNRKRIKASSVFLFFHRKVARLGSFFFKQTETEKNKKTKTRESRSVLGGITEITRLSVFGSHNPVPRMLFLALSLPESLLLLIPGALYRVIPGRRRTHLRRQADLVSSHVYDVSHVLLSICTNSSSRRFFSQGLLGGSSCCNSRAVYLPL